MNNNREYQIKKKENKLNLEIANELGAHLEKNKEYHKKHYEKNKYDKKMKRKP